MIELTLNLIKTKFQVRDFEDKCFKYKYMKYLLASYIILNF